MKNRIALFTLLEILLLSSCVLATINNETLQSSHQLEPDAKVRRKLRQGKNIKLKGEIRDETKSLEEGLGDQTWLGRKMTRRKTRVHKVRGSLFSLDLWK